MRSPRGFMLTKTDKRLRSHSGNTQVQDALEKTYKNDKEETLKKMKTEKNSLPLWWLLLSHYHHAHDTSDTRCVGVLAPPSNFLLKHQLSFLQFTLILTLSGDSVNPQNYGLSGTRLSPPPILHTDPKCKLLPVLLTKWL